MVLRRKLKTTSASASVCRNQNYVGSTEKLDFQQDILSSYSELRVDRRLSLEGSVLLEPVVEGFCFPTTDSTTLVPDRSTWDTDLRIGAPGAAMRYFSGVLDEVRVYARALSTEEILLIATP